MKPVRLTDGRDEANDWHSWVDVSLDGGAPTRYCGETWCDGQCGLPALTIGDLRLVDSAVAIGHVMQPVMRPWKGQRVEAPAAHQERLRKLLWI